MNSISECKNEICRKLQSVDCSGREKILNPGGRNGCKYYPLKVRIGTSLVRLKRYLRKHNKELEDMYYRKDYIFEKAVQITRTSTGDFCDSSGEIKNQLIQLEGSIEQNEEVLAVVGGFLHCLLDLYNQLATDHDFAQIINVNIKQVEKHRKDYDEKSYDKFDSFFIKLITSYCIEPENDQVFLNALIANIVREKKKNYETV